MLHGASFRNGRCWGPPARVIQKATDTEGGALNSSQEPKNWGRMFVKIPKQTRHAHSSHKQDSFGQWVSARARPAASSRGPPSLHISPAHLSQSEP